MAALVTLALGSQVGLAAPSADRDAPQPVRSVEVTATDSTSVTIVWPASRDRVAGYGVYVNGNRVGDETPDRLKWWRERLTYTIRDLTCGTGYTVGVDAYNRDDNRSEVTTTTVSTSACPDSTPPSTPAGARQVAATENSVVLAWTPSTDNVGVVEYGLYASGVRVSTVSDANATLTNLTCGTTYLVGIDAADAAGNRSGRASSFFRTAACPSTNKPPTTPAGLRVAAATSTSVTLAWTAATDDVAVAGYGLYVSGSRTGDTTMTSAAFSGLKCGTAYTLGVDAFDGAGKRSTVAELSAATSACAPPPPSGTGTVKQTIANGSTVSGVVNWRAVYDRNGDNVEDDPGSIDFLVDGTLVLTEEHMPFGDWTGHWTSTSVPNGQHTFLVRAKDAAGTVLASNTVTATVANGTPPTAGSVTQTIPNGARLSGTIDWRAVYDRNGDRVQDDPGSIRFLVDGNVVLSEESIPFGDWTGHWASRSVPNGSHTFEVRALDGAGTVVASNRVTATVENNAPAGDTTPPSSPGNTRVASATGNSVTVAWSAAADNVGVNGYGLYRSGNRTGETSQTTATFTGLSCGTAYQVGVDAYDAAGNRSTRSDVAATTAPCADTQPPTAPTNVTASNRTTTSITLTWAPATDNVGVAAYGIYNAGDLVHTTAGTTGIVSGLACGTNHTLAVDAFDGAGNSSSRTTVMVSTLPCADTAPPTQPSSLRATATTTSSITLAWNASTDNVAVVGYDVYRSTTKVGTTAGTTYTIAGLTCATTYPTGVRALDAAGNASTQANLNVTTAPCAAPPPPPPPPPSSGFPDAGNTGVRAGVTLTAYTGPTAITTPNTVIDGKTLGCVQIEAPGVVIRNSRLSCNPGGTAVVINRRTGSETWALIEDSEIDCRNGANSAGFGNSNLIIRRVEIQNCENGLNVQRNVTIEDSYVHNGYNEGESHMDGMQFTSAADNVRIVHNTILGVGNNGQLGTSSLIADLPGHSNWLIENNLFGGGAYTVYCVAGRGTNWIIRNNRFTLQYGRNGTSGAFGFATECSDETQSGNVVHETGQPITLG